ncbi:protein tramtrack, beta isoform-like isoform X3 [Pseudomyrmex gracilis]|uniref:protein tramtrack, beta isoform-like isoform X3 n=1 Tax=Pseudomyrmex gracilis TaxID=219809 RepID=UPI0009951876|nr:protein tramtrack, beta isoform-like isoform X3 [Pseudomyrmex gracilis]
MGSSQQFSLRWNNYLKHITCAFDTLRTDEDLVDVTLSCEGKKIRAHKMLLSACSTYFRDLFKENPCQHPIIIFRNVKFDDLAALVDFMYQGEVNVVQEQLGSFLSTAGLLAVQGLTDGTGKDNDSLVEDDIEIPNEPEVQLQNTSSKAERDNKRIKSPSSPLPYHATELPEAPQPKRRKTRESTINVEKNSVGNNGSSKDADGKNQIENQTGQVSDPVEIIPLMPNLKLEMPEYLEQDGSSCSYEDQGIGDATINKLGMEDTASHDEKVDISQTFYSSQSTSDGLDGKHQSADVGHMHSKPGTSGERPSQEAIQESEHNYGKHQPPQQQQLPPQHTSLVLDGIKRRSKLHYVVESGRWVCDVCGRTYNRGDSLAHHRSIHRGDTICPICQTVFTRKYTMRCHMVNVHGVK